MFDTCKFFLYSMKFIIHFQLFNFKHQTFFYFLFILCLDTSFIVKFIPCVLFICCIFINQMFYGCLYILCVLVFFKTLHWILSPKAPVQQPPVPLVEDLWPVVIWRLTSCWWSGKLDSYANQNPWWHYCDHSEKKQRNRKLMHFWPYFERCE